MRNAPTNRTIAATSAVVRLEIRGRAAKRRARCRPASTGRTARAVGDPRARCATVSGSAPGARPMSTRVDAVVARTTRLRDRRAGRRRCARRARRAGPSPARIPTTRNVWRSPEPWIVIGEPTRRPSSAASCSVIERARLRRLAEAGAGDERQLVECGSRDRVDAERPSRRRQASAGSRPGRDTSAARSRARRSRTPGRLGDRLPASRSQARPRRSRRPAGPPGRPGRGRSGRPTRRSRRRRERGEQDGDAERDADDA